MMLFLVQYCELLDVRQKKRGKGIQFNLFQIESKDASSTTFSVVQNMSNKIRQKQFSGNLSTLYVVYLLSFQSKWVLAVKKVVGKPQGVLLSCGASTKPATAQALASFVEADINERYGNALAPSPACIVVKDECQKAKADSGLECFYYLYRFIKGTEPDRIIMDGLKISRMKQKLHSLLMIINEKLLLSVPKRAQDREFIKNFKFYDKQFREIALQTEPDAHASSPQKGKPAKTGQQVNSLSLSQLQYMNYSPEAQLEQQITQKSQALSQIISKSPLRDLKKSQNFVLTEIQTSLLEPLCPIESARNHTASQTSLKPKGYWQLQTPKSQAQQ